MTTKLSNWCQSFVFSGGHWQDNIITDLSIMAQLWHCAPWNTTRRCGLMEPGCFTDISWALRDILSKFVYCRNRTSYNNFKLKLCMGALGTCTKLQLDILIINVISGIVYFHEIILESSWSISEINDTAVVRESWENFALGMAFMRLYSVENLTRIHQWKCMLSVNVVLWDFNSKLFLKGLCCLICTWRLS